MTKNCYQQLAKALDELPGRFPETPSHVELRLLEKAFTPEEAVVAAKMTRKHELVGDIAKRSGLSETKTREILQKLLPRRLVRSREINGQTEYRLGPFVVGWYEAMMQGPMSRDVEFAMLFEQYMKEGGGEKIMSPRPGLMGVVPVRGSLKPELLQPYDDIDAHFGRHERFGVMNCVCRMERNLLGSECTQPVNRCGFVGLPPQTPLSEHVLNQEQALRLFAELEDEGHVHTGMYGFISGADSPQFVGCCNCCGDCCGILRAVNDFGAKEGPQKSNYRAVLNSEDCVSCGICVSRCQVHAIHDTQAGIPEINRDQCIGCGLCVVKCPGKAIELVPVSKEEWFNVPTSFENWEERRLANMSAQA